MSVENVQVLKALLDLKRQQVILARRTTDTASLIESSYAYAMDRRICPFFHTDDTDPFDPAYSVSRSFMKDVLAYCDEKWLQKEPLTFYDLETHFGRDHRHDLICILRYAALSHRFDDNFYRRLAASCPTEAHGLNDDFRDSEISVV